MAAARASQPSSISKVTQPEEQEMDFDSKVENGEHGNTRFPHMNFMDETIEQLSIFQNKEVGQYRNIKLDNLKKDQMYAKRLELSVENLNQKLSRLKS